MYARTRWIAVALVLVGCGGLPRALRNQITAEKQNIDQAKTQLQHSIDAVKADLAHSPDLFKNAPAAQQWPSQLDSDRATLDRAGNDLRDIEKAKPQRAEQLVS